MAGGMDFGSRTHGGRKSLDASINLVPFIDMMAVTISFLIMTSVWQQLGKLPVKQEGKASATTVEAPADAVPVELLVTNLGFELVAGSTRLALPKEQGRYLLCQRDGLDLVVGDCEAGTLVGELQKLKQALPDQQQIVVRFEDGVRYEDMVEVIDACNLRDAERRPLLFPAVTVGSTTG